MDGDQIQPYGAWASPLTPEGMATLVTMFDSIYVHKPTGKVYVVEVRPDEGGRGAIVELSTSNPHGRDVLPPPYSALSQVHEYGGASVGVRANGHLLFTDLTSKAVLDLDPATGALTTIVPGDRLIYYAHFSEHPSDSDWILAVREDHRCDTIKDIKNTIVSINARTGAIAEVVHGCDFYNYPRFSADGNRMSWVQWNHPEMPWTCTELWVADWKAGQRGEGRIVTGGQGTAESITQPLWSPTGSLYFVSDLTGYWQIYEHRDTFATPRHIQLKGLEDAEFGMPDWELGNQSYDFLSADELVAMVNKSGRKFLVTIKTCTSSWKDLESPIVDTGAGNAVRVLDSNHFVVIGSTYQVPSSVFSFNLEKESKPEQSTWKSSTKHQLLSPEYISKPKHISFKRQHGTQGGTAHALLYLPVNPKHAAPAGSLPPLIISCHGGPTSQRLQGLDLYDQFWTTRGYAIAQLNYTGSSGYGREYRRGLLTKWGINDVGDAVSCVEALIDQGLVNQKAVAITGRSAGGFMTMQAMASFPEVWTTAIAESSVSDLTLLQAETHKFESHYLDDLIFSRNASYDSDTVQRILRERSPLAKAHRVKAAMLVLSGQDDPICPPNQQVRWAHEIQETGGTVQLHIYPGEGHSFKNKITIQDVWTQKENWFAKHLVCDPQVTGLSAPSV